MKNRFIILLILFSSCAKHHEMEELSLNIGKSNSSSIDKIFVENKIYTMYYMDSVLLGIKPSKYFKGELDFFSGEYAIISIKNSFLRYKYYSALNSEGSSILISLFDKKNEERLIHFYFDQESDLWILKNIEIEDRLDYNIKPNE